MSEFLAAWPTVLRHEGGYVNNQNDPGGATKYGISLRWLKAQGLHGDVNGDLTVDIRDIQALTTETAASFYQVQWWDKYKFGRLLDQAVATKLFDTAVNMGTPQAVRFLQMSINSLQTLQTTVDGQLGPSTVQEANAQPASPLLHRMQDYQAARYQQLAANNPRFSEFLTGWVNRAYDRV